MTSGVDDAPTSIDSISMFAPFIGIGRVVTPLSSERGRAPNKRLIPANALRQATEGGFVYVNEISHAASLVFLSKKSFANAYESFATVRKGP